MEILCPVCGKDTIKKKGSSSHAEGHHTIFSSFTCEKCGGDITATIFKNGKEIESTEIKYNKKKQSDCVNNTFA